MQEHPEGKLLREGADEHTRNEVHSLTVPHVWQRKRNRLEHTSELLLSLGCLHAFRSVGTLEVSLNLISNLLRQLRLIILDQGNNLAIDRGLSIKAVLFNEGFFYLAVLAEFSPEVEPHCRVQVSKAHQPLDDLVLHNQPVRSLARLGEKDELTDSEKSENLIPLDDDFLDKFDVKGHRGKCRWAREN